MYCLSGTRTMNDIKQPKPDLLPSGLPSEIAAQRLKNEGANELGTSQRRALGGIVRDVLTEPMFMLLLVAGSIYLMMGDRSEALALLGFVAIIMGITVFQERRTDNALAALRDLSSPRALVRRDGQMMRIAGHELVREDCLLLAEGDRVPADARLRAHRGRAEQRFEFQKIRIIDQTQDDFAHVDGFAVVGGQTLAWREPELFAHTGNGYAVTIKFDPAEPTLGCAIFNRETGTKNRDGWALGLFLGLADHEPDAPQICAQRGFLTEVEVESLARRKRYTSAIRAEYRGIVGRDAPPVRASEARNGRGEIVRIEEGRGDNVTRGGGDKSSGHRATVSPGHLEDRGLAQPRPRAAATRDRMMDLILGG